MSLLYFDEQFLLHDTGAHPECALRLTRTVEHLRATGIWQQWQHVEAPQASADEIARAHDRDHIRQIEQITRQGGGRVETDTVVSAGSYMAAARAVGAACDAVRQVVRGNSLTAFCLIRPPGHHALPSAPMGFCLFNNIAVAARVAIDELELNRVLIVDWDVHHGNGTQDCFWEDGQVGFYSVHRAPFYPGTGAADETGSGPGLGATCNEPVAFGTSRPEFFARVERSLTRFADRLRPDLVLISAGFDSHRLDPVGSLGLETDDFTTLTQLVVRLAQQHSQGRVVSLLEGGYNVDVLPQCVARHLDALARNIDS